MIAHAGKALCDRGLVNVVALDVVMPRRDGLDRLRVLRQSHAVPPVLRVSGRWTEVDSLRVHARGPKARLATPYRWADVRQASDALCSVRG